MKKEGLGGEKVREAQGRVVEVDPEPHRDVVDSPSMSLFWEGSLYPEGQKRRRESCVSSKEAEAEGETPQAVTVAMRGRGVESAPVVVEEVKGGMEMEMRAPNAVEPCHLPLMGSGGLMYTEEFTGDRV